MHEINTYSYLLIEFSHLTDKQNPTTSCKQIKQRMPNSPSGMYLNNGWKCNKYPLCLLSYGGALWI